MPIGKRIKKAREENLGISKKELAQLLNITQSAVNQWETGVSLPSQKRLIELCRVLNVTYEWLISGIQSQDKQENAIELPFYEEIKCSAGNGYINSEAEKIMISSDLIPLPSDKINRHIILIKSYGDSMEPAISDGSVLFVDTSDTKIIDGRIYVYLKDDVLRVKRLEYYSTGLIIKSVNPNYSDEKISLKEFANFCVVGRVLYSINKF